MSRYIRRRAGVTVFFTVALAQRESRLLVAEVERLRQAVRDTHAERPSAIEGEERPETVRWTTFSDERAKPRRRSRSHPRRGGFRGASALLLVQSGEARAGDAGAGLAVLLGSPRDRRAAMGMGHRPPVGCVVSPHRYAAGWCVRSTHPTLGAFSWEVFARYLRFNHLHFASASPDRSYQIKGAVLIVGTPPLPVNVIVHDLRRNICVH